MRTKLAAALFAILWLCLGARAEPTASLSGRVTSGGGPLANATVMVNSAYPIKGLAYYCPGCYRDCGKTATTDPEGNWIISGLDDTLKFELLIVAKNHVPQFTPVTNPAVNMPVNVEIHARDIASLPSEQVVRGRVLRADGTPIKHAVVSPDMVYTQDSGCGGRCEGLDLMAVTDEEGRFALVYAKPCVSMDLGVSARGYAHTCFPRRASGGKEHELRIIEGAGVGGRLVRDGKPVADVEITLVADQSTGRACFDRQVIATNKEGQFLFVNVFPGQKYILSASTAQLKSGCVEPKDVMVSKDGEEIDAGDLGVIRGVRLSGRVLQPRDGKLPAGAKLTLSSERGWDSITIDLPEDGTFSFPEVARGGYSLHLTSPGVHVSHRNPSVDKVNNMNLLVGRIDNDIVGMEIETTTERPKDVSRGNPAEWPEIGGIEKK